MFAEVLVTRDFEDAFRQGSTPLNGGRNGGLLSIHLELLLAGRCSRCSRWGLLSGSSAPPFGRRQGGRGATIPQQFTQTPEMISQATGHRWRDHNLTCKPFFPGLPSAEFAMRKAPVVGGADQPHACLNHLKAMRSMAAATGQRGQTLSESSIEALDKSRVEHLACVGGFQDLHCSRQSPLQHVARHLHHAFLLPVFVDDPNEDVWPRLSTGPTNAIGIGDLFTKGPIDASRIRCKPVAADQEGHQWQAASSHEAEQLVGELLVTGLTDDAP